MNEGNISYTVRYAKIFYSRYLFRIAFIILYIGFLFIFFSDRTLFQLIGISAIPLIFELQFYKLEAYGRFVPIGPILNVLSKKSENKNLIYFVHFVYMSLLFLCLTISIVLYMIKG
ncbi:hypothetical protein QWZ13_15735 [Reinekea marina]|uniref:hypothetical protein n=1 Tax=Reinekea marina TaxID=1310421 RepID=UPI0025B4E823|nr:hypothetical protein [Reinekea marina]MDN3650358.1 hypothetical protein [Reinekea marina]